MGSRMLTEDEELEIALRQIRDMENTILQQNEDTLKGENVYDLYAILIHQGGAFGGHYFAYIKSFEDG
jgi:ubiquitin carboxyl-terminal hydrolase 47